MRVLAIAMLAILTSASFVSAQQSTARRGTPPPSIEPLATDYLLIATLTLSRDPPIPMHREALGPQLQELVKTHKIDYSERRAHVSVPEGAHMRAADGLMFFWSETTWYDPIDLTYFSRGSLPEMQFMGSYDMTLAGGKFKLVLPDGFRARLNKVEYVVEKGKWRVAK